MMWATALGVGATWRSRVPTPAVGGFKSSKTRPFIRISIPRGQYGILSCEILYMGLDFMDANLPPCHAAMRLGFPTVI